jgi:hypothetical protein
VWQAKSITVKYHKNNPDGTTESTATQVFTYDSTGTREFGKNSDNSYKWTPTTNYAENYGFGVWYFPGYKIRGWSESSTATDPAYHSTVNTNPSYVPV